jgi:GNAT superfamily N-acetyltransferase
VSAGSLAGRLAFVGELGGRIVGFYSLIPSVREWDLDDLWVLPALMGRGIGRALLMHASHTAAEGGATLLRIESDPYAEQFYIACGAERVGAVVAPIEGEPDRIRPVLLPVAHLTCVDRCGIGRSCGPSLARILGVAT